MEIPAGIYQEPGTLKKFLITISVSALALQSGALSSGAALAETPSSLDTPVDSSSAAQAVQPLRGKDAYRALFGSLRAGNWAEVKSRAAALDKDDPVRAVALSEFYTAKDSPRVELFDLLDLLNTASWLPDADQLGRLAQKRGAQVLPNGAQVQKLAYVGSAPRRRYLPTTKEDLSAQALVAQIQPYISKDDPAGAEALVGNAERTLSPDGLAEVRQRVAWSYYIENDDDNARRLATRVLETGSTNDWSVQAHWTIGMASWRQNDPKSAAMAFEQVARRASNEDMRAAGSYWAARSWMNAGQPARVSGWLKDAAARSGTFYGMLARETLGMDAPRAAIANASESSLRSVSRAPAVKAAIALNDIGEITLADELLKRQAELSGANDYDALLSLSESMNLPVTQLWLSQRSPAGRQPDSFAHFPRPNWTPDGGWRVDPALIFAHALQESNFRADAVSPAGARGLMQVMPGTAKDMAGGTVNASRLHNPSTNMEYGQRYLEQLRDMSATGGLLPKVMAAYNAGPAPVMRWNSEVKDGGDPLLFMESLPYYETRAYVNIVMRNYWMYQLRDNGKAEAMTAMAQGKWPAFPTMRGGKPTQMSYRVTK
ncbi:MAG: lytic transglycosylase domain-containing protein [Sphingobium sp.]|nr:lytic transglycosylase domain-containing protein [Sphingobium sp.]